ncbi:major facilitator superfamily domain-containing protein [Cokeromyces recurvatus]|uniref:major facilitator superfamily domain-containing protein n=1 Tax=Cokeromyces recurvatus TaxID=90255 RepID=UPI00221E440B|nr:major facilitator superfamily domain-containing protein [Cokeromyces recurvatus]KAI7904253.1 major facilitator superfamily domain-containing protein [Cokeromyces recurvatus]
MKFKLPSIFRTAVIEEKEEKKVDNNSTITEEKIRNYSNDKNVPEAVETQYGVRNAEASNQVWTKEQLILVYILIWILQFILALASGVNRSLTPYVTSSFKEHSLTTTTTVISSIVSGVIVLPFAKLLNVWGRPQGFGIMVCSITIGLIMMAVCDSVKTFCAAQVFYVVGYNSITFSLTIFIADTTSLRNRAFMIAFTSSPWIATIWAAGPAAESILKTIGFRWGFGIWAIVVPIVSLPVFGLFYYNLVKARKAGLIPKVEQDPKRGWKESIVYHAKEFDMVGLLLICSGLTLFLLSFNLYSHQPDEWRSPLIICFLIFGSLLIISFGAWEKWGASITFIPWELMMDRTVFFTFTMAASLYLSWYLWNGFFYSYLIVVHNLSVAHTTYITNIYTVGSTTWAIVMGIIIRYNGRLKWLALYFGVPVTILGVGLMIQFRQPDVHVGFIVMCQIFISLGGGTLVICEQMTVMAVASHQYVSAVLSMEYMIINIASAIGSTIASAMWMGIFPKKLAYYLPEDSLDNLESIYGSIEVQSSYVYGSPERNAISESYSDTQRLMLITSTCMYIITLISVLFWKDIDVKKLKKIEDLIF